MHDDVFFWAAPTLSVFEKTIIGKNTSLTQNQPVYTMTQALEGRQQTSISSNPRVKTFKLMFSVLSVEFVPKIELAD